MAFGTVNGPVIFIIFLHDIDSTWKELACCRGISIDNNNNNKIIVDDNFSWYPIFKTCLKCLTCHFLASLLKNLSISLKNILSLPTRMKFVGIDICTNINLPVMSNHQLQKVWLDFVMVRYIASFICFLNLYYQCIPYFKQHAAPLRALIKLDMDHTIASTLTVKHEDF